MINGLKNLLKKIINSFRIPSLIDFILKPWKEAKANAPAASKNWDRLGLEKNWKPFCVLLLVIVLAIKNYIVDFIVNIISKIQILAFKGEGSPLTIVYKANALIYFVDTSIMLVGYGLICYLTYLIFKE